MWNLRGLKCELGKFPGGGPVVGTQRFHRVAWGQSLGEELRTCKLSSAVQKQKHQPKI